VDKVVDNKKTVDHNLIHTSPTEQLKTVWLLMNDTDALRLPKSLVFIPLPVDYDTTRTSTVFINYCLLIIDLTNSCITGSAIIE